MVFSGLAAASFFIGVSFELFWSLSSTVEQENRMKKNLWMTLGIVVLVLWAVWQFFGGTYNKLVAGEEGVKSAWAQVQNAYQRRLDLIPNLVSTVKGYAAHEKETLAQITEARAKVGSMQVGPEILNDPAKFQQFQQAQGQLGSVLSRLMVVMERYPDLKANQNFLELQNQLEGTENRISVERRRYNDAAQAFNTFLRQIPNNFIAKLSGFQAKAYFEADAAAAQAPSVKF